MKKLFILFVIQITLSTSIIFAQKKCAPKPLFVDPNYFGSCDPEVVYNPDDKCWYVYYTSRRALLENNFLQTPIGVIKSKDLVKWTFEGYCKFDGIGGTKDMPSTYWAPAIIVDKEMMHMFVTWKPDTTTVAGAWGGPGKIVHYQTSVANPVSGWTKVSDMHSANYNTLDATVYSQNDTIHVWFKGKLAKAKKNELFHRVSTDFKTWSDEGFTQSDVFNKAASGSDFEEAPYIFQWKGFYWLLTDPHKGLFFYKSTDGEQWKFQGTILEEGGKGELDNSMARHCSVAVKGDRAFIFYHVEPWREYTDVPIFKQPLSNRKSVLQIAELKFDKGKLSCNRDLKICF